jgi:hypothetical protein
MKATQLTKSIFLSVLLLASSLAFSQNLFINSSFETPSIDVSAANYHGITYAPTGGTWSFGAGAGICHNGCDWGAMVAPAGSQFAFIQGASNSYFSQTVTLDPGNYAITFNATLGGNDNQTIQITVDGNPLSDIKITSAYPTFELYRSNGFNIATTGTHVIKFAGTVSGDNKAFIDQINISNVNSTTRLISVKTADVAKYTNTHKQWQFEMLSFRMYNTVAGKYLTGHSDGSVTLEVKDETSTAPRQYWSLYHSQNGGVYFRNIGTAVGPANYIRNLSFVTTGGDNGTGTTTLSMNLLPFDGSGSSELNLSNAQNLTPVPGTSYTINTISWYTRSIVANAGNTSIEAIDNNSNISYNQWKFEVVASEPTYPEMTYYKRIFNTKAGKYLTSQNNAGVYSPVLVPKDQTATAALQYWKIVSGLYGSILFRNFGAGGVNDLHQGVTGATDLVAGGTHEVNQTTTDGTGEALLQLDDNSVKVPVQGTAYSIQSINWYNRSLICNIVDNTGGNLTATGLTDSEFANSNLKISSGEFVIDASKTLNSITVAPGAKLTLGSGVLNATSGITLQSDATGTATLVDNTINAPQALTATVQQYVTSGRSWYMSIPLASGESSLLSRGTSVVCYDEPTSTWIAPVANALDKLRGYIQVATSTPSVTGTSGTVDFTGVVNTGSQSINLTRTAGKTGFNLVGNPYPSYLDWNAVTKTNISNTMWFRTKEGGVYKFYTYNTIDGAGGIGVPASVTRYIPPMQAFWVRVNTVGTGSITLDNNMRSHKDVSGNIMKAPSQTPQQLLRLQVSNGTNTDETVVYFNANASDNFDKFDAQKRTNGEPSVPEIFTQVGTEQLVINGMNQVKYNTEIPIGFSTLTAANNNSLSISANEMTNFETGTRVILIDKENPSVETELTNGTAYSFSAPVTAPTTNRFSLVFRAPGVATGVDNASKLNAHVYVNAANQITIIAPEKSTYSVYNTVGQMIENGIFNAKRETINAKLNAGVYVVKVNNVTNRVILK